ncbi:membrane-bound lytic murein transglycosylase MltF [Halieaceae bacterium IMCC14734]|uniref:Membrane-bound lytic murein transglycosylase F n=1 Tax=Candidatus Litorirhabdus singularis TaxID=2518993 RepID=A0ABT3THF1_9GAMM|nr:membrane-bound lytic murein transglycosylase MltF [Candidatus Litorirhabdus singularis]MCX2981760.1 membrane-bound lytic murein transglycosylase MltF [Candidatus Litorirhabdus singularis]
MPRLPLQLSFWLCLLLISGCENGDSLAMILEKGEISIATRNAPTTFYQVQDEAAGFEFVLASLFAEELGVNARFIQLHNKADVVESLQRGQADMAAAGMARTAERASLFDATNSYGELHLQIVYLAGTKRPRQISDLAQGRLVISNSQRHIDTVTFLRSLQPALEWRQIDTEDSAELLEMVTDREADFALIDSNEFKVNRSFYPRMRVAMELDRVDELAWLMPDARDNTRLLNRANQFLARVSADGTLERLKEEHFSRAWNNNPVGSQTFNRMVRTKLPRYETLIREVAKEYQLDWHLLAAIAYQESHWNPRARSPTGVRGMMMLTRSTAKELGIVDRLDVTESLRGGARYYKLLKRRLPEDILEPDRTWFTLAAYNIGRGHLEDARVITQRQGGDPHFWKDVSQYLPLLQKSAYYSKARYGYARGSEPVTYVKNIRHYHSILAWRDINQNQPAPPVNSIELLPPILRETGLFAL